MSLSVSDTILAVVTLDRAVAGGGAPIFYVRDQAEQEAVSRILSHILNAMAHDLQNGTYIIVKH